MLAKIKQWFWNNLVAVDRLFNTVCGGTPDQSVSGRLWKHFPNSFMRKFVDFIFGQGHCKEASDFDDGVKEVLY